VHWGIACWFLVPSSTLCTQPCILGSWGSYKSGTLANWPTQARRGETGLFLLLVLVAPLQMTVCLQGPWLTPASLTLCSSTMAPASCLQPHRFQTGQVAPSGSRACRCPSPQPLSEEPSLQFLLPFLLSLVPYFESPLYLMHFKFLFLTEPWCIKAVF
jgi:hypothetical protein